MRATATATSRGRRLFATAATATTTLLLLLILAIVAVAPQPAAAHKSKLRGRTCDTLEKTCGFITDGGGGGDGSIVGGFAEARFTLTAADDGTVSCDPDSDCSYDPDAGVLVMQTYCPGGSDYTVIQSTCAPLVPDPNDPTNPDAFVLEPRIVGFYVNNYFEGSYCTVYQPTTPSPGESLTWVINVYCVKGIPEVAAAAGAKVAAAAKRKVGGSVAAAAAGAKKASASG